MCRVHRPSRTRTTHARIWFMGFEPKPCIGVVGGGGVDLGNGMSVRLGVLKFTKILREPYSCMVSFCYGKKFLNSKS